MGCGHAKTANINLHILSVMIRQIICWANEKLNLDSSLIKVNEALIIKKTASLTTQYKANYTQRTSVKSIFISLLSASIWHDSPLLSDD